MEFFLRKLKMEEIGLVQVQTVPLYNLKVIEKKGREWIQGV